MSSSFADILTKSSSDVDAPKLLPRGTYLGTVQGQFKEIKNEKSGNSGAEFTIALQQPYSDVNQAEFSEAYPRGLNGKTVRYTQWVGDDGGFFLKQFLTGTLGLAEGPSIGELLSQAPGRQLLVTIKHIPSNRGDHMIAVPNSVAAV